MASSSRRHFLSWDRPLLPQAVRFLAGDWPGGRPLDLSSTLVVVPTRQSGRRLREALAEHAAARGSAVFAPQVVTPEALAVLAAPGTARTASRLEALVGWIEVLRALDLADFREVFPVDPPSRNVNWASRLGEQLLRVQATLAENALRLADVAERAGDDFVERARWRQLGRLESLHDERLARAGLAAPGPATAAASAGPAAWASLTRIVLLGTPDPLATVVRWLADAPLPVDVVIHAPAAEADAFDAWGRPRPEVWASRPVALADVANRVTLCADPTDEAARVAQLAAAYARPGDGEAAPDAWLAVGLADREVLTLLEAEAPRAGVPGFNPEGRLRRSGALYHLLAALAAVAQAASFEAVAALARCPDFLRYLERRLAPDFRAATFLAQLDRLRLRHLPADLAAAQTQAVRGGERLRVAAAGLAVIADVCGRLQNGGFPGEVPAVLAELFAERTLGGSDPAEARLRDAATAWMATLRDCAAAADAFPQLTPADWWELALRSFGDSRADEDKPAGAIELQGWLELLFEDAPHLVLAGANDGLLPEAVSEDGFLPDSLRTRLGLRNNASRFARDAYLLQAVAAARAERGRLDVLFARTSAAGDPLRPSRLLLRCPDPELPARIAALFRAPDPAGSHLPWTRAWPLRPQVEPARTPVAVTALRRWLLCPFRFYLQYGLRMEAVDAAKSELDAFDFGTLCHGALEAMGRERGLRDCTDPAVLRDFLLTHLARSADATFGADRALPLLIQVESARQRLAKFADLQARERAAGWVFERIEHEINLEIAGVQIRGKVDRIDRHEVTGAIRVVDYKTSDTAVNPATAHLRPLGKADVVPDWMRVNLDDKPRVWKDLQLPLYRAALASEFGSEIACGYINLPKAVAETGLAVWEDYTPELQGAAIRCAEGVCRAIAAGEFWPPNEEIRAESDDFAALFHHGVAASVDWRGGVSAERGGEA